MSRGPRKPKEVLEVEARDRELYAMKRSEFQPRLHGCKFCGREIAMHWIHGVGQVCDECLEIIGRATPAEPDGNHGRGPEAQLALFES